MELQNESASIFADSNFFISLANPEDNLHSKANEYSRAIEAKKSPIVISNFIFLEVVTIISQRQNRLAAVKAGEELQSNPQIKIVMIDKDLQKSSWEIFQELLRKNISFVDCSIVAIMEAEGIKSLLTFDRTDFTPLRKQYHFRFFE